MPQKRYKYLTTSQLSYCSVDIMPRIRTEACYVSSKKIFPYLYVGNVATQGSGCHRGGSRYLFTTVCRASSWENFGKLKNSTRRDGDEGGTQSGKSLLSALRPVQNCGDDDNLRLRLGVNDRRAHLETRAEQSLLVHSPRAHPTLPRERPEADIGLSAKRTVL